MKLLFNQLTAFARHKISDQLFRKIPMQRDRHLRWSFTEKQMFMCCHFFKPKHTNGLGWPDSCTSQPPAHHIKLLDSSF
jgi:hypothetical protein